jgi:hypothetical protein
MVGSNQGSASTMQAEMFKQKAIVEIKMIQVKKREDAWIGAGITEKGLRLDGFESLAHEAGRQSPRPLIEIANHDSWTSEIGLIQNVGAQQSPDLMTPLDESGSQVNIEEVENGMADLKISPQTAASLPFAPGDIVIAAKLHG